MTDENTRTAIEMSASDSAEDPGRVKRWTDDSFEVGPFCSVCWDVDGKLVREYHSSSCSSCGSGARKAKS